MKPRRRKEEEEEEEEKRTEKGECEGKEKGKREDVKRVENAGRQVRELMQHETNGYTHARPRHGLASQRGSNEQSRQWTGSSQQVRTIVVTALQQQAVSPRNPQGTSSLPVCRWINLTVHT